MNNTGTRMYRNYFPIKFGWQGDCKYGILYPVFVKPMYPSDVFKVHADLLIRYQPMIAPPMNDTIAKVRFAFVPLRLLEENTELVITGSKEGNLSNETIPTLDSVFKYLDLSSHNTIEKGSMLDLIYDIPTGIQLTNELLQKLDADPASPALWIAKAFYRFWWDYYRPEDFFGSDFEQSWNYQKTVLHTEFASLSSCLKKDRFTSSLPWQLKANVAPTIEVSSSGTMVPNFQGDIIEPHVGVPDFPIGIDGNSKPLDSYVESSGGFQQLITATGDSNQAFRDYLNQPQQINLSTIGFNAAQFRDMMAQTRIFERLARTGSRYTEYLRANFGIAPSDGTMQRAQYLGGFTTHIVTTEVIQTAGASNDLGQNTPVGTLRGHGITHGNSTIKPFMAKEIGVMIAFLDIQPETIYAQGVDRELTLRNRFDFLNPSFQHLSEQEVRKGEIYFDIDVDSNGRLRNSETWGFQPYAQELRTGVKHVHGELRDTLSYWNQALIFSSRPELNFAFLDSHNHQASYNRPFAVTDTTVSPMVVDFGGVIEAYRPLVKEGIPGYADHN